MNNYLQPDWPAPANIKAYTTTRQCWIGNRHEENTHLKTLLNLPEQPIFFDQTHSAIALPAIPENKNQIGDAAFTNQTNRVCAILTADCLPLLICNKQGTHVAAIHAGWKGLAAGIIESTLQSLNQPSEDLLVWLGPAIGPQKFEVGEDVYQAFVSKHQESESAFVPHNHDQNNHDQTQRKWLANLYALAKIRLKLQGVTQIFGGEFCTYSQEDLFFSYRRDRGRTGRMVSLIWIETP